MKKKKKELIEKVSSQTDFKPRASGYSHYGASYAKKSLSSWIASSGSADEDIVENIETLRDRSRDLYMGVPLATGVLKTIRTNVVGSGLRLKSQVDASVLGLSPEEAEEWKRNIEREWALWANSPACDAGRLLNFAQIQAMVLMSALMNGDVFVALPNISKPDSPYQLKIQMIEADRVCNPNFLTFNSNVLEGVEIGRYGEPVAYYVAKYHPDNQHRPLSDPMQDWKRVPAYGALSGRRNILHIMTDFERIGQRRGVPLLAPVIEAFKQLGRYTDAELVAAVVSGYFSVFITSQAPESGLPSPLSPNFGEMTQDPNDVAMGPGIVATLNQGESIQTANPGRPNTAFEGFVTAICRQIGAATEVPYELLIKNFTASYSASRASLLEAWKMFRMRRSWLISNLCEPVFEAWLSEAVATGRIQAPGFFEDVRIKKAWLRADWSGDAQGQLDPQKEASAAKIRVDEGFSTREREASELTGMDIDDINMQRSREEEQRRALNISAPPSSPPQFSDEGDDNIGE